MIKHYYMNDSFNISLNINTANNGPTTNIIDEKDITSVSDYIEIKTPQYNGQLFSGQILTVNNYNLYFNLIQRGPQ